MTQQRSKVNVESSSGKVAYLDKDRVIRILRRNDRFLSLLHDEDAVLIEDDRVEAELEHYKNIERKSA